MLYYLYNWSKGKWFIGSKFRKYLRKNQNCTRWDVFVENETNQCRHSNVDGDTTYRKFIQHWFMGEEGEHIEGIFTTIQETYLSVKLDARVFVGTHELRITPRILSNPCLNPLDPKFRPLTSFPASVTISVLPRLLQATNCHSKAIFRTTSKPKIKVEKFIMAWDVWTTEKNILTCALVKKIVLFLPFSLFE